MGVPDPISDVIKEFPGMKSVVSDGYQSISSQLKIDHSFVGDDQAKGMQYLLHIIKNASARKIVVFTSYITRTIDIQQALEDNGVSASVLHSDQDIEDRAEGLFEFLSGRTRVLVGTELAARALGEQVEHVILYNIPSDYSAILGRVNLSSKRVSCTVRNGDEELAAKIKPGGKLILEGNRRIRKRSKKNTLV